VPEYRPTCGGLIPPPRLALLSLLQALAARGELASFVGDLRTELAGTPAEALALRYLDLNLPAPCVAGGLGRIAWRGRVAGSLLIGEILSESGEVICTITLRSPDGPLSAEAAAALQITDVQRRRDFPWECGPTGKFTVTGTVKQLQMVLLGESDCFDIGGCSPTTTPVLPEFVCDVGIGQPVNPYTLGIRGNWRLQRNWSYLTLRRSAARRGEAGAFSGGFHPFWRIFPGSSASHEGWHWTEMTNVINPLGRALESRDALDRYDGAVFGYQFSVPIETALDARLQQVAFDGFEDYDYENRITYPGECQPPRHWSFQESGLSPDQTRSHTGRFSLLLPRERSASVNRAISPPCDDETTGPTGNLYLLQRCDLIAPFSPIGGGGITYVLSGWVSTRTGTTPDPVPVAGPRIVVLLGTSELPAFEAAGPNVDGWQRVEGTFEIPEGAATIGVRLESGPVDAWFDDLRIEPKNAKGQAFVYDPKDLRFIATLDGNNFAQRYEFDEEGALARIERETVRGLLTVQEVSSASPKNR
jgi:hypothetical protein